MGPEQQNIQHRNEHDKFRHGPIPLQTLVKLYLPAAVKGHYGSITFNIESMRQKVTRSGLSSRLVDSHNRPAATKDHHGGVMTAIHSTSRRTRQTDPSSGPMNSPSPPAAEYSDHRIHSNNTFDIKMSKARHHSCLIPSHAHPRITPPATTHWRLNSSGIR